MFKKLMVSSALGMSFLVGTVALAAQEPTIDQVYQAMKSGHVNDAQNMMNQVLKNHPSSATAHYVEAQVLAEQGRGAEAAAELQTADRLQPGLPKENATAVAALRNRIAMETAPAPVRQQPRIVQQPVSAPASSEIPWGMVLLVILAVVVFIVFVSRMMGRNNAVQPMPGGYGPTGVPMGGGYGPGYGMGGGMGGGMGSGILGGLATGVAVGAGVAAGEELVHHFTGGNNSSQNYIPQQGNALPPDDLGGQDFGVSDASSWGDSSGGGDMGGGGGGDWN